MGFFGSLAQAAPYFADVIENKRQRDRQAVQDQVVAQQNQRQQDAATRAAALQGKQIENIDSEIAARGNGGKWQVQQTSKGLVAVNPVTLETKNLYEPDSAPTAPRGPQPLSSFAGGTTDALRSSMGLRSTAPAGPPAVNVSEPTDTPEPAPRQQLQPKVPKVAAPADKLVVTVKDGKRVYTPSSQAAGTEAPSPAPKAPTAAKPKYGSFIDPKQPGSQPVYITQDEAAQRGLIPAPTGTGAASIKTKIASNRTEIATITDALAELDKHPAAVGMNRSFGDWMNQRTDPEGVAARASLANIGSLKLHDRSGAAVTASESPRLMPFIPSIKDNVDVARTKLRKLAQQVETETQLLEQSGGGGAGTGGRGGGGQSTGIDLNDATDAEFEALLAKAKKRTTP